MNERKDEIKTQRNRVWQSLMKREGNSKYKNDKGVKWWKQNLSIIVVKNDK